MSVYYVDQGAYGVGSGSDAGAGTSGDPWETLDYALTQCVDGDFIWITGQGEYAAGDLDFDTAAVNVSIVGYGSTTGDATKATLRAASGGTANADFMKGGNNAIVHYENLDIDGNDQQYEIINNTSSACKFENVDFHNFGTTSSKVTQNMIGGRPNHSNIRMWDIYCTGFVLYGWGARLNNIYARDIECGTLIDGVNSDENFLNGFFFYNIEATNQVVEWENISTATISNGIIHTVGNGSGGKGDAIEIDRDERYMALRNVAIWDANIGLKNATGTFNNDYNRISLRNVFMGSVTTQISNSGDTFGSVTTLTADPLDTNLQINETAGGGAVLRAVTEDLNGATQYPFGRWFAPSSGGAGGISRELLDKAAAMGGLRVRSTA